MRLFKLFKFKDRIGAVHSPYFFLSPLFSDRVDMALHKQALFFTGSFQFVFKLPDVVLVLRQQCIVLDQFIGKRFVLC